MKLIDNDRTFNIGSNPGGGAYIKFFAECVRDYEALGCRRSKQIPKRLVCNKYGAPDDGGANPEINSDHVKSWRAMCEVTVTDDERVKYAVFLERRGDEEQALHAKWRQENEKHNAWLNAE